MEATLDYETRLWLAGHHYIAGVDEVGRGCLAGAVVAGAVILPIHDRVVCNLLRTAKVRDSKKLSHRQRTALLPLIQDIALGVGVGAASAIEIDTHGLVSAYRLAMARAIRALPCEPTALLIDGPYSGSFFSSKKGLMSDDEILQAPNLRSDDEISISSPVKRANPSVQPVQENVIRGDSASLSIASAAIIAKVYRDNLMVEADEQFPGYGFASHKGYGTAKHLKALRTLGASPIHRMTWKPLRELKIVQMELQI